MIDPLWQFAIGNTAMAAALAAIAWAVQMRGRWPQVAHLLWLLVLARLIVPPVLPVPIFTDAGPFGAAVGMLSAVIEPALLPAEPIAPIGTGTVAITDRPLASSAFAPLSIEAIRLSLLLIWGAGSTLLLVWTLVQFHRFNGHLRRCATDASPYLRETASEIARRLGLKTCPRIRTTAACLSPMVWSGPRAQLLVPDALMRNMTGEQLRGVLAHELAHVRRRDHWVRWLEWLSCILFWWNPLVWWARRNLRLNEEICCDALALAAVDSRPRHYANTLVTAAELLAAPAMRPSPLACRMNTAKTLERRLTMILTRAPNATAPRAIHCLLLCTALLLPLGGTHAQATLHPPKTGAWHASSHTARAMTGDILVTKSGLVFENGDRLALAPALPGSKAVFTVDPAAVPARFRNDQLCSAPITHVTVLIYNDFAMAIHLHDGADLPPEPTPGTLTAIAQRGKCASYYYRVAN